MVVLGNFYEYKGSEPGYWGKPVKALPKRNICQPSYVGKRAIPYVSHKDCFYGEFEDGTGWDMIDVFGPQVDPPSTPPILFDLQGLLCDS